MLIVSQTLAAQVAELDYTVSYSFVKCADIKVKISDCQDYIKVFAVGKSCGLANFFFNVDEKYDCYIDKKNNYLPIKIEKVSTTNDSIKYINLVFDRYNNTVTNSIIGTYNISPDTYDFLSGLLLIARDDFFNNTDERKLNIFFDNSPCVLHVKYCDDKVVNDVDCKKLELKITKTASDAKNKKFISLITTNSTHYVYVTKSQPSVLVYAKINLVVGSLKIELRQPIMH